MIRNQSVLLLGVILFGGSVAIVPAQSKNSRPNVLFILADDHRADGIAALGNPQLRTPTLDKLVARGMAFRRAYVMGSTEGAVCMPSRSMIQTGRSLYRLPKTNLRKGYEDFSGAMKDKVEGKDWALLPRVMNAAGYATFHIGKRGNECVPAIESYGKNIIRDDTGPEARASSSRGHADQVIEYLRERKPDRPFFIYLAPPVPHDPRVAQQEFMDLYDPAKISLPPAFMPLHPFDNGEMTVRDEQLAPWPRPPDNLRRQLADYYACITGLDHHLGRIFDCLKELGQLDNTIIIFAGDNGLSLGEHGLMGKQNLYEFGGMHVPLVVAGPGIKYGESDAFVYLFDLFPTICDLTRTSVPRAVDGKSFAPLLAGKKMKGREVMFNTYKNVQRSLRDDRWKLIQYPQINRTQFFDLKNDPYELNDLASQSAQADRIKKMLERMEKAQKEFGDDCALTVANPKPAAWAPPAEKPAAPGAAKKSKNTQL